MKKIFFCCFLMTGAILLKAQSSPVPMRTSDPAPLVNAVKVTLPMGSGGAAPAAVSRQQLPMRSGGASPAATATKPQLPMRMGDGGGGGSTGGTKAPGFLNPALNNANAANSTGQRVSDQPVKQDSTQKH